MQHTSVIRNGQYLGVAPQRNGKTVSSGSLMKVLGEAKLQMFYNDGGKVCARYTQDSGVGVAPASCSGVDNVGLLP